MSIPIYHIYSLLTHKHNEVCFYNTPTQFVEPVAISDRVAGRNSALSMKSHKNCLEYLL